MKIKRNPSAFFKTEYENLVRLGLNWELNTLESASEPECVVNGKKVIMMCSNNYINLSTHPKVVKAMVETTEKYGAGAGSDRSIAGNMSIHEELDETLAKFKKADASLTFQSGYVVNEGLIPQLVDKDDVIISDELNHGSIIDGVRLTKAKRFVPVSSMHHFGHVWDGYAFWRQLFEEVEVRL